MSLEMQARRSVRRSLGQIFRKPFASVAVLIVASLVGGVSVAYASSASSSLSTFFGPTLIGGSYLCGKQQAEIVTDSHAAYGIVNAWDGSSCANPDNRPSGQIGTVQTLFKGTSGSGGTVCGFTDWTYNSGSAQEIDVPAFWSGPNTNCPSGAAYYAQSKGRFWNSNNGSYVTSSFYSNSPNLNF